MSDVIASRYLDSGTQVPGLWSPACYTNNMLGLFVGDLKEHRFLLSVGAGLLICSALAQYWFTWLVFAPIAKALQGNVSKWPYFAGIIMASVVQFAAILAFPYYAGLKLKRYGLAYGACWSILLFSIGYVLAEFNLSPAYNDLEKQLLADLPVVKVDMTDYLNVFIPPIAACLLGEMRAKKLAAKTS